MESVLRAVLFADVCDSTAIYQSLGDAQALALINRVLGLLQKRCAAHGGRLVKTLGDAVVCECDDPDAAFRGACDMQEAVARLPSIGGRTLAVKVGLTYGPVVIEAGDLFGDTVNVCARLVGLANAAQILTAQETVDALPRVLRARCRALYPLKVRGRAGDVSVWEIVWRMDPDMTLTGVPALAPSGKKWQLKLTYQGETFAIGPEASARIGRDRANDVVVESAHASRTHARIFGRAGHFVLADQSSKGTYVLSDGSTHELLLKREESALGERGWIGLGSSAAQHGDHVLRFRLEHS